jgi:segregation and condensation protein B
MTVETIREVNAVMVAELPAGEEQHLRLLEAILFASAEPLHERELAAHLPADADLAGLLARLQEAYRHRGVVLVQAGKSWAFRTASDLAPWLSRTAAVERRLSRAAIETLAIIAYHQPVTRAEIEGIRGVQLSKGTLDVLLDQGWIRPRGRRQTPGRPLTWGTTDLFLDHFSLQDLADLPGVDDLRAAGLLETGPAAGPFAPVQDGSSEDGAGNEQSGEIP